MEGARSQFVLGSGRWFAGVPWCAWLERALGRLVRGVGERRWKRRKGEEERGNGVRGAAPAPGF